jgi:CHAD domain-containing protein
VEESTDLAVTTRGFAMPDGKRAFAASVPMKKEEPAPLVFRRVLLHLARTIEAHRDGTIEGDAEHLHDLRVAVRRTRSVLADAKRVLPEDIRGSYRERFGWLGQRTGPARDLDVFILAWDEQSAPLGDVAPGVLSGIRREVEAARVAEHSELATVLQGEEYRELVSSWVAWLANPGADDDLSSDDAVGAVVARRVGRAHKRLVQDGRAIKADSPPERLHDLRKDAKRLRYLLECFAPVFPRTEHKRFVTYLKRLQNVLGAHQDAAVHLSALRELEHQLNARSVIDVEALDAIARLSDHLEARRAAARADFTERFARFDRKRPHKALEKMVKKASEAPRSGR